MLKRNFGEKEYARRCAAAQSFMAEMNLDALLFTTEAELFYFSGFYTPFWRSPTRPWFLLLPWRGKPIAIVPSIGAALMARCHVNDVVAWESPSAEDEGVSAVSDQCRREGVARLGMMQGRQSYLRMSPRDFRRLQERLSDVEFVDVSDAVHALRQQKSHREIEKIARCCELVSGVFAGLPEWARAGMTLREVCRQFTIKCLQAGVDEVSYLACGAGPGGYDDVISPPTDAVLQNGDILMLDTGCVMDGYYCDFNRNYLFGGGSDNISDAYQTLWQATEAGLNAARAGTRCSEVFAAMDEVIRTAGYGGEASVAPGRYGHGLGIELTETPSLVAWDDTVLRAGMVMTIEPSLVYGGGMTMVHEEDIVITDAAPRLLTRRADKILPIILS